MSEPTNPVVTPNPNGTTLDPGQGPTVLTASPLPADFATMQPAQKLAELDKQPSPWDNTVSLGTVFRRAETFNASMHLVFDILNNLKVRYSSKKSDNKARKALHALIEAFNTFVFTFGNAQYADYTHLLVDGKLGTQLHIEEGTPFVPLAAGAKPASLLETFVKGLQLFVDSQPKLTEVKFGLGVASAADIIMAVVKAGKKFLEVFTDGEGGVFTESLVQDPGEGPSGQGSSALSSAAESDVPFPLPRVIQPGAMLAL